MKKKAKKIGIVDPIEQGKLDWIRERAEFMRGERCVGPEHWECSPNMSCQVQNVKSHSTIRHGT